MREEIRRKILDRARVARARGARKKNGRADELGSADLARQMKKKSRCSCRTNEIQAAAAALFCLEFCLAAAGPDYYKYIRIRFFFAAFSPSATTSLISILF